jgi:hypothetical protein
VTEIIIRCALAPKVIRGLTIPYVVSPDYLTVTILRKYAIVHRVLVFHLIWSNKMHMLPFCGCTFPYLWMNALADNSLDMHTSHTEKNLKSTANKSENQHQYDPPSDSLILYLFIQQATN